MKTACLFLLCLLLLAPAALFGQGTYLEKGVNGLGVELRGIWTPAGFDGLGVMSGYSIAGILDIGSDFALSLEELDGNEATDLRAAFAYSVNLLKQSEGMPLSLQVRGSYGVTNSISRYLEDDGAARRGTGYTIGLAISRSLRVSSLVFIRLNALADYESVTFTTVGGASIPDSTDYRRNLYFGGGAGVTLRFPGGAALAVHTELCGDQELELYIRPVIAVAFPRD